MLPTYLGGALVGEATATGDTFTNHASLTATTTPIPGSPETGTVTVQDDSHWTLTTGSESIDKLIAPRSLSGGTCPTDVSVYGEPAAFAPDETLFRKGDRVCYLLTVHFSGLTETRNPQVTDFLPPAMTYVAGPRRRRATNAGAPFTVPSTRQRPCSSSIGTAGPAGNRFVDPGAVFAAVIQANVTDGSARDHGPDAVEPHEAARRELGRHRTDVPRQPGDERRAGATRRGWSRVSSPSTHPPTGPNGREQQRRRVRGARELRRDVPHRRDQRGRRRHAERLRGRRAGRLGQAAGPAARATNVGNVRFEPAQPVAPTVTCTDPGQTGHPRSSARPTSACCV